MKLISNSFCQITLGNWKGETGRDEFMAFQREVIERMVEPPWFSNVAQERNLPVCTSWLLKMYPKSTSCVFLLFKKKEDVRLYEAKSSQTVFGSRHGNIKLAIYYNKEMGTRLLDQLVSNCFHLCRCYG